MNCKSTVEMLSAYLDRELGTQERNAIRAHLADCDRCRSEERDLRALKGLLLGVRAPEPAAGFEQRLLMRLHAEAAAPVRRRFEFPSLRPLALGQLGGLAAASALATLMLVHPPQRRTAEVSRPVHRAAAVQPADYDGYEAYVRADDFAGGTSLAISNNAP